MSLLLKFMGVNLQLVLWMALSDSCDVRTPEILNQLKWTSDAKVMAKIPKTVQIKRLVCTKRPHIQQVERVVGISFQHGLDPAKIVSASQAGDIQFLDIRNHKDTYLTIDDYRGSLSALVIHRHAPVIASGSAKQLIKVFSLQGEQLSTIRYHHTSFMAQKIGSVSCLTFHPYQVLLAAGYADASVSIHA